MPLSQPNLVAGIVRLIGKLGQADMNVRQMNAIIEAANVIVEAFDRPHVSAKPGIGINAWFASDDTGLSSRYLACRLFDRFNPDIIKHGKYTPADAADFNRCLVMLAATNKTAADVQAVIRLYQDNNAWHLIATNWEKLEQLYNAKDYSKLNAWLMAYNNGQTELRAYE